MTYASYTTVEGDTIKSTIQVVVKLDDNIMINLDFNNEEEYVRMKTALGSRVYYHADGKDYDSKGNPQYSLTLFTEDKKLATFFINQIIKHKPDLKGIVREIVLFDLDLNHSYHTIDEVPTWIESIKNEIVDKNGNDHYLRMWYFRNTAEKPKIPSILIMSTSDEPGFQIFAEYSSNIKGNDLTDVIGVNVPLFMRLLMSEGDYFNSQEIEPEITGTLETYLDRIRQIEPGLTIDVYNRLVDVVNSLLPSGSGLINYQSDNTEVFFDAMKPPKELSYIGQFYRMLEKRENRQPIESVLPAPEEFNYLTTSSECYGTRFMQSPNEINTIKENHLEYQSFESFLSPLSFTSKNARPPSPVSYTAQLNSQLCFLSWLSSSLCALLPNHWQRPLKEIEKQKLCKIKMESALGEELHLLRSGTIYHSELYQEHIDALIRDWRLIKYTIQSILKVEHTSNAQYHQLVQSYDAVVIKVADFKSINDDIQNKRAYVPAGQCLVMQYSIEKGAIQYKLEPLDKTNKADPIICKSDLKSCYDLSRLQQTIDKIVNPYNQDALHLPVSGKVRQSKIT